MCRLVVKKEHMLTLATPYIFPAKLPLFCHWIVTFSTFSYNFVLKHLLSCGFILNTVVMFLWVPIWRCLLWCVTGDWIGSGPAARGGGGTQYSAAGSGPSSYLGDSSCKLIFSFNMFVILFFFLTYKERGVYFVVYIIMNIY